MTYQEWQLKRRVLADKEKAERSQNWENARAPLQASITEQAIRELYDMNRLLGERVAILEQRRGPGRPPNPKEPE